MTTPAESPSIRAVREALLRSERRRGYDLTHRAEAVHAALLALSLDQRVALAAELAGVPVNGIEFIREVEAFVLKEWAKK